MADAVVNGVRLDYEIDGPDDGEAVLLVCGCGQPAVAWRIGVSPALAAAGYRVVTYDNRGVAPSEATAAPYSVDQLADDAAALVDHLGLGPVHVIGHSLGGWIAETLAIRRPDLLRSAALLGSLNRGTSWEKAITTVERDLARSGVALPALFSAVETLRYLPNAALQDDAIVDAWLPMLAGAPEWENPGRLGQYEAALAWSNDDARTGRWPGITVRCLVLAFEHDVDSPPRHAEEAAVEIPGARFVELPGLSHLGPFEDPGAVVPVLLDFLSSPLRS